MWIAALGIVCGAAHCEEHEVHTFGARWVPPVLLIEAGDSVVWRGMKGHETQLIEGMAPAAATSWKSSLDEEGFKVTFEHEGAYLYKCHAHIQAGMIGAIIVGDGEPQNLPALEAALPEVVAGRAAVARLIARVKREAASRAE